MNSNYAHSYSYQLCLLGRQTGKLEKKWVKPLQPRLGESGPPKPEPRNPLQRPSGKQEHTGKVAFAVEDAREWLA